jgi:xanthine dehydrogenase accessory factor
MSHPLDLPDDDAASDRDAPGVPHVRVTVVDAIGSTPADAGAAMLVGAEGRRGGTVGGGKIEARAIAEAIALLNDASSRPTRFFDFNLKTDIGMTCGGSMKLYLERVGVTAWPIAVFGAGHVAQSLVRLLLTLPCEVTCIDPRPEWLARLPGHGRLRTLRLDEPAEAVDGLAATTFALCMTRGHASDRPILERLLRRDPPLPFVGVIGSRSKAAVLRRELAEAGLTAAQLAPMVCPLGLPIGENHPGEIAVSIAAQLLETRDRLRREPMRQDG